MLTDISIAFLIVLLLEMIGILSEYLKSFVILLSCLCWLGVYLVNGYKISFIGEMEFSMWIACVVIFDIILSHILKYLKKVAIADLGDMPTIDPVHAAGGCYCYECDNHCSDGSCCIRRDSWGARLKVGDHDFCSDGSRNKEKTNET